MSPLWSRQLTYQFPALFCLLKFKHLTATRPRILLTDRCVMYFCRITYLERINYITYFDRITYITYLTESNTILCQTSLTVLLTAVVLLCTGVGGRVFSTRAPAQSVTAGSAPVLLKLSENTIFVK